MNYTTLENLNLDLDEQEVNKYKNEKKRPNKLVNDIFKKLSTKLHPDKGGDKELFQQANEAKENNNLVLNVLLISMQTHYPWYRD